MLFLAIEAPFLALYITPFIGFQRFCHVFEVGKVDIPELGDIRISNAKISIALAVNNQTHSNFSHQF